MTQIPPWGRRLLRRLHDEGVTPWPFDQLLVNEYRAGEGIALHRDYSQFDRVVVSLSLLSACVMEFQKCGTRNKVALLLEPRSLLILSDEARTAWEHGIARRKSDRWEGRVIRRTRRLSLTLRRRITLT